MSVAALARQIEALEASLGCLICPASFSNHDVVHHVPKSAHPQVPLRPSRIVFLSVVHVRFWRPCNIDDLRGLGSEYHCYVPASVSRHSLSARYRPVHVKMKILGLHHVLMYKN
ncbi:hypothetical protein PV04_00200 [Phialophora macrospora]|uniref:Uncharacterized protein n=1 Tax=Phialophora macrospora TaxID=1851006 RepID=A0A0D2FZS3_9EURO|nr:hypothetical protein PV04_00200 [Phialophora macrospora]